VCKYSLEVGDSFEIQDANGKHLHFIVAEESGSDHSALILVYMSSANSIYKDTTTIIRYGEHPYITDPEIESWIRYQNTEIFSRADICVKITNHYGKISDDLLDRIQKGLLSSKMVPKRIKKVFDEWKMNHLFDEL
jgi:hypothetical protein